MYFFFIVFLWYVHFFKNIYPSILVFSWLDNNNLTEVPAEALKSLKELKYLYVCNLFLIHTVNALNPGVTSYNVQGRLHPTKQSPNYYY